MLNYSIHTYELFTKISLEEFWQIFDTLKGLHTAIEKKENDYSCYNQLEITEYTFRQLPYYGINYIRLHKTDSPYAAINCILYIVINPYNAYMHQFYSDENIIKAEYIPCAVEIINKQLSLFLSPAICNSLKPTRIDFCVNLYFSTQKQAEEYIKLLRLGVPFKHLKEYTKYDSVQKRKIPYPHSLLLQCKSYSFEIYSKYLQMQTQDLLTNAEAALGIVRIELRAGRSKLKTISNKHKRDLVSAAYVDGLKDIANIAKIEIQHIVRLMVGNCDFYPFTYVKERISNANFRNYQKELMLLVSLYFSKKHKGQDLLTKFDFSRNDWNRLLEKYNLLNCSPIPVPRSFSQSIYPGIDSWDTCF